MSVLPVLAQFDKTWYNTTSMREENKTMNEGLFDYERSLWDNVVLDALRQGFLASEAIASADTIISARRNTFTNKDNS
jgi:hypothetical protein